MNYNELKMMAESKKITIKQLAEELELSSNGLKRSIEGETMSMKTVRHLCEFMQISIAEFFGEAPEGGSSMAAEPVPYRNSAIKKNLITDNATIDVLVRHIAWLETEIDRLRGVGGKKRSAAV